MMFPGEEEDPIPTLHTLTFLLSLLLLRHPHLPRWPARFQRTEISGKLKKHEWDGMGRTPRISTILLIAPVLPDPTKRQACRSSAEHADFIFCRASSPVPVGKRIRMWRTREEKRGKGGKTETETDGIDSFVVPLSIPPNACSRTKAGPDPVQHVIIINKIYPAAHRSCPPCSG
jgi:hypothetical protein